MNIRNTKAWKLAECEYEEFYNYTTIPLFGNRTTPEDKIERLEQILKRCPKFYPALLDLALQRMLSTSNDSADDQIKEGFNLMLELSDPSHIEEEFDILLDNLEKLWRFDLCKYFLGIMIERYPHKAFLYDYQAHATAMIGEIDEALVYVEKALQLAPKNHHFRSNQGWLYLIAGDPKKAGESLEAALRLKPDAEVAKKNLEIQKYLAKHGGNYFDYLLRPVDEERLEHLRNEEQWEDFDDIVTEYNNDRFEAVAQTIMQEHSEKIPRLYDLMATLREFFRFVHRIDQDVHLNEDIDFIQEYFKPIMHKFIFKFGDVDVEMIEGIYSALLEYYEFLSNRGLISSKAFNQFQKKILGMKKELIGKMQKYNAIRHRSDIDGDEKQAIRGELFEGDDEWPFL